MDGVQGFDFAVGYPVRNVFTPVNILRNLCQKFQYPLNEFVIHQVNTVILFQTITAYPVLVISLNKMAKNYGQFMFNV